MKIVKKEKVLIFDNKKSWYVIEIFINWIKFVFLNYQKLEAKEPCLLILDKTPSHLNEKVIQFLNDNNIKRIFIPDGPTTKLQLLDVAVNKPFKDYVNNNI